MKFMIEKQINHSLAFFNVFLSGVYNQNLTLQHITNEPIQDLS